LRQPSSTPSAHDAFFDDVLAVLSFLDRARQEHVPAPYRPGSAEFRFWSWRFENFANSLCGSAPVRMPARVAAILS
jgi:hypothetical protein